MIPFLYGLSTFLVCYSAFGLAYFQPIITNNTGYFAWVHLICLLAILCVSGAVLLILTLTSDERGNV